MDTYHTELRALSELAVPPRLVQYNQWGQRIDVLQTSEGWRGLQALMQREGVIGLFYERKHGEYSRVHGFAKLLIAGGEAQMVIIDAERERYEGVYFLRAD